MEFKIKPRENLFRAWDQDQNKMVYDFETTPYFDSRVITKYNYNKIMQYVGKSDKNNKKIYELDILPVVYIDPLDWEKRKYQTNGVVIFKNCKFGILYENNYNEKVFTDFNYLKEYPVSIQGNFYQNPKLILNN